MVDSKLVYVGLGALFVGYVAGVMKQRMKDSREIVAAGPEGSAFAAKLGSLRPTLTTKAQGRMSDLRMILALDEPLTNSKTVLHETSGMWGMY